MKRAWILLVLTLGALLGGCGMVDSVPERTRRYGNELDYLARQASDDWDFFWLAERPSYLSEWHARDAD